MSIHQFFQRFFLGTQGFVHRFQKNPGMKGDNDGFAGRYIYIYIVYIYIFFFSNIYLYQIYEKSINSQCSFHPSAPIILSSRPMPFSGVSRTVGGAKSPAGRLAGRDITLSRESKW